MVGSDPDHWCPPCRVLEHHQITASGIDHRQADFGTDVGGGGVIPHPVRIGNEVDEGVEGAVGHRTDVDRRGTERAVLPATQVLDRTT